MHYIPVHLHSLGYCDWLLFVLFDALSVVLTFVSVCACLIFQSQNASYVVESPVMRGKLLLCICTFVHVRVRRCLSGHVFGVSARPLPWRARTAPQLVREAVRNTAYTFIHKPINLDYLLNLLDRVHRQQTSSAGSASS